MFLAAKTILPEAVLLEVRSEGVESGKWITELGMSQMNECSFNARDMESSQRF